MRLFLNSLSELLPSLRANAEAVLRVPKNEQWDALYYTIILSHLVQQRDYDPVLVERARVLWFRYVSVCGRAQEGRGARRPEVDMPRMRPLRNSAWRATPVLQGLITLSASIRR